MGSDGPTANASGGNNLVERQASPFTSDGGGSSSDRLSSMLSIQGASATRNRLPSWMLVGASSSEVNTMRLRAHQDGMVAGPAWSPGSPNNKSTSQRNSISHARERRDVAAQPMPVGGADEAMMEGHRLTRVLLSNVMGKQSEDLLDGLELRSMLAVGSMGSIYNATYHGQRIVCKVIEHGVALLDRVKDRRKLAVLEGAIGNKLVHPNIVSTFGFYTGLVPAAKLLLPHMRRGSAESAPPRDATLILQEYCAAGSLRTALDKGELLSVMSGMREVVDDDARSFERFRVVAHIASQVAAALVHAHSCGVVHCDVKAENVLLQYPPTEACFEGDIRIRALLSDFGVAKIVPLKGGSRVLHGATPGTLSCMPPETLSPPFAFSTATDVWSLGMLLWELWTQNVPFQGLSRQQVVHCIQTQDLPQWPPKSPPLLERLAQACWSLDPATRPTAQKVATALSQAADALSRTHHTLKGGAASLAPEQRFQIIEHLDDDALEEALLATDVKLVHSAESGETQAQADDEASCLSEPPPAHDGVAMFLWHLMHFPGEEECLTVEINPMRSLLVSPLPYQEGFGFSI